MRVGPSDKALHDMMVLIQVQTYQKEGARIIAADIQGWPSPPKISKHVPDIMVEYQGKVVYNEVETCETILSPQTKEQLQEFARWATLHVTVPKSCYDKSRQTVREWGVKVDRWWLYGGI